MRTRLALGALFAIAWLAAGGLFSLADDPPAAKPPAAAPASSADKKAEKPAEKSAAQTEAQKQEEREFYELYKSLADTVDQVDRNYVTKVDRRELMKAAIKGVLTKLDPYSNYIGADDAEQFRDTVEAQFAGIGIQIGMDPENRLRILSPLVGTPAYKAGLLAGDRIVKIAGEPTADLSLDDVVHKLKGQPGTAVSLTVLHAGDTEPQTVSVTREFIHVETVLGDRRKPDDTWDFMLDADKRIGYIRINTFGRDTPRDLKRALEDLRGRKLCGLVIDLRSNPGGLLTSAIEVCDLFLNEGRIVSTEGRNSPKHVWDATKKSDAFAGFPMAVLVNHYSASASEITAACLQDHGRAVIVGTRTWGKGSVQNMIDLEDGKSLLKLTTATYMRPNGHNIHRFPDAKETDEWGVSPNAGYEVKLSDQEMFEQMIDRRDRDILTPHKKGAAGDAANGAASSAGKRVDDRQLDKAIEYLTAELARAK